MRQIYVLITIVFVVSTTSLPAQYAKTDTSFKKMFVGSTVFLMGNLLPENKPDFVQINLGYRITARDVFSIEVKTWKYAWSLGIPFGPSFEAPEEKFPGFIREFGLALVYQRFLWEGLYVAAHSMGAFQRFVDDDGANIDNGFQVFNTYRLGYHFRLFGDKFFIEPSIAITHRAYHTEMPDSFKQLDDKWSKFFFGEPGLHFGYNF